VKHNTGRLRTAILGPLALAATIAVTAAVSGCSSATSAQPAAHAVAQSGCSLNPSPPPGFTEQKTSAGGIGNYVRGGHGPTLLLVAGYPQTWYAWDDILPELARHYTVVAPDLPGSGGSDAPAGTSAYTKKAMAGDLYQLLAKLGLEKNVRIVGHDIGTMVAYSYAAAHPDDVTKLVLSEARSWRRPMIVLRAYAHFHSAHRPQRALRRCACPALWPATSPAPVSSGSSGVNALVTLFTSGGSSMSAEPLTPASEDKARVTGRVGPQVKQERQNGESHSGQRLDESGQGRSGEQRQRGQRPPAAGPKFG